MGLGCAGGCVVDGGKVPQVDLWRWEWVREGSGGECVEGCGWRGVAWGIEQTGGGRPQVQPVGWVRAPWEGGWTDSSGLHQTSREISPAPADPPAGPARWTSTSILRPASPNSRPRNLYRRPAPRSPKISPRISHNPAPARASCAPPRRTAGPARRRRPRWRRRQRRARRAAGAATPWGVISQGRAGGLGEEACGSFQGVGRAMLGGWPPNLNQTEAAQAQAGGAGPRPLPSPGCMRLQPPRAPPET